MFTVCPKCALTLAVTAADLRVAQGYVRCGRCSSVFNALARLTEERQASAASEPLTLLPEADPAAPAAATEAAPPATATEAAPPAAATEAAPAPAPPASTSTDPTGPLAEESLEFNPATTDVNSVFVQPPPDPQWTAATGSFRALVAANQETPAAERLPDSQVDVEIDSAFLASMLRTENHAPDEVPPAALAAPAPPPMPAPPPVPPAAAVPGRAPAHSAPAVAAKALGTRHHEPHVRPAAAAVLSPAARAPLPPPSAAVPVERARAVSPAGPALIEDEEAEEAAGAAADDAPAGVLQRALGYLRARAWSIGAVLAALVLIGQLINHSRDDLAASARFNRPLTALYGALGIKLYPRWDLRAYDVRQLGASAADAGAGVITVRATIKNESPQAQPLPLLRVTLQDRFGNRIAARDVQPRAYLPGAIPSSSFLSAGQRIDAEIGLADPGTDAVGFEIDACLPARGGTACANDAALR